MRRLGRRRMLSAAGLFLIASASGCASGRTLLVSEDSPMRIGPGTTGTVYRLVDGEWKLGSDRVTLPEGWYVVPPRFVHPEDFE